MFNLDQAIAEWREQMLAAGIKAPVPLEELESHLREEIEQQTDSGSSEAEAFKTAVRKMGLAGELRVEFRKIEATKKLSQWNLWQFFFGAFSFLFSLKMGGAVLFKTGVYGGLTPGQQVSCLAATITMLLLVCGGRLGYRLFPVIRAKGVRQAIGYGGFLPMLWWVAFFCIIVPAYDLDIGQARVVTFFHWSIAISTGAPIGLIWAIETAARKKVAAG